MIEQADMFPEIIPSDVCRYWKAILALRKLKPGKKLSLTDVVDRMRIDEPDLPASVETIRRWRKKKYPDLVRWPVGPTEPPPWLTSPELLEQLIDATPMTLKPPDTLHLQTLEGVTVRATRGEDGVYRIVHLSGGVAVAAAALIASVVMDGLDGNFDHVIHWCLLLAHALPQLRL